jgi:integrase
MKVPIKVIQEILGHSSIVITHNIYGHVIAKMQEDAAYKMNDLFKENGAN